MSKTLKTVFRNLLEGALLVTLVLYLFLADLRAAAIVASIIPQALLGTFIGLSLVGIPANLLSLCNDYKTEIINNVTLASFPGCVFRVRVSVCVQQDLILGTEIFVGNYELLDATDCPELWEEWSNLVLDPESQAGEINEFVNNLDQQVYARLENYLYAKHGNKVGCGSPLGTLTVSFLKASCSTICSHQYEQNPYPKDGGDGSFDNEVTESRLSDKYGTLVRANCDTNGCCQRRTSI